MWQIGDCRSGDADEMCECCDRRIALRGALDADEVRTSVPQDTRLCADDVFDAKGRSIKDVKDEAKRLSKLLVFGVACGSSGNRLRIRHGGDQSVTIVPAFEDYAFMMAEVCAAMKLSTDECLIYPMNGDLGGNAIATVLDGNRILVYDRHLSSLVGSDGAETLIAHEVGHHFCGHLNSEPSHELELKADRFAGATLKLMGRTLESALAAVPLFDERPSKSHPEKRLRIEAITAGWNDPELGRDCRPKPT
jgi:hypothetical protein